MGRRTPFIDKKRATSYSLVFASAEDGNGNAGADPDAPAADGGPPSSAPRPAADRILVSSALGVGIGRPDAAAVAAASANRPPPRYPPHHPLAWLENEDGAAGAAAGASSLTPARRREMLDLGFPDDGYDYLRHLREPAQARAVEMSGEDGVGEETGAAAAAAAAAPAPAAAPVVPAGPSVFLPAPSTSRPAPDVRVFDASSLTIHAPARDDDDAAAAAGGVTVLARAVGRVRRQAVAEVDALAGAEATLEAGAVAGVAAAADGVGDLQDDFVLLAAEAGATVECEEGGEAEAEGGRSGSGSEWEAEAEEEGEEGGEEGGGGRGGRDTLADLPPRRPAGSIASTYWRPPRRDRPAALSEIDDAFEALALNYDSDEIGSLGSSGGGDGSDSRSDGDEGDEGGGDAPSGRARRGDAGGVPQRDASAFAGVFASFLAHHGPGSGGVYRSPAEAAAAAAAAAAAEAAGVPLSVSEALDAVEGATAAAALVATRAAVARVRAEEGSEEEAADEEVEVEAAPLSSSSSDDGAWRDHPRRSAVAARAAAAAAAAEAHADARWDCETVLSAATSASTFRPGVLEVDGGRRRRRRPPPPSPASSAGPLDQILLSTKTGLPLGTGRAGLPLTPRAPAPQVDEGVATPARAAAPPPAAARRPGESPAERKARKAAVKATRADARATKKETRLLFKEAAVKQAAWAAVPAPSVVHIQ